MAASVRFQTPLEEIPADAPSLLEQMLEFLNQPQHLSDQKLFQDYEKDRGVLMKGKEELERGQLKPETRKDGRSLMVGLLLLHLKFQTEPLLSSAVYEQACKIILETKGSTALAEAFGALINGLHPKRKAVVDAFFSYMWHLQSHPDNGLDSIALATRFGNFILRPPSGTEASLPRVKLMGALAVLIEAHRGGPEGLASPRAPSPRPAPQSGSVTASAPTRSHKSPSIAGVQVMDVSRSAVVVIDSSLKALEKVRAEIAGSQDPAQLRALLKRLRYLDSIAEGKTKQQQQQQQQQQQEEYSI